MQQNSIEENKKEKSLNIENDNVEDRNSSAWSDSESDDETTKKNIQLSTLSSKKLFKLNKLEDSSEYDFSQILSAINIDKTDKGEKKQVDIIDNNIA